MAPNREPSTHDIIEGACQLIVDSVAHGVHESMRPFLLPLVAAVESMIEEAEKNG